MWRAAHVSSLMPLEFHVPTTCVVAILSAGSRVYHVSPHVSIQVNIQLLLLSALAHILSSKPHVRNAWISDVLIANPANARQLYRNRKP